MLKWVALLVTAALACRDGVDNVVEVFDTTHGNGKILFHDVEIWTYDMHKNPSCSGGSASFQLPGYFKVAKGTIEIREEVKETSLLLALSAEQNSWLVGVICLNGASKSSYVSDDLCKYDFCKLTGMCGRISSKSRVDISHFIPKDLIYSGPSPSSHVPGDWKVSAQVLHGKTVIAGVRLGKGGSWLKVGSKSHGEL